MRPSPERAEQTTGRDTLADLLPQRPEFERFAEIYARDVAPFLAAQETRRRAARAKLIARAPFAVAAAVAGFAIGFLIERATGADGTGETLAAFAKIGGFAVGAGIVGPAWLERRRVMNEARERLARTIADGLGLTYARKPDARPGFDAIDHWGLFPRHDKVHTEDRFTGAWRGVDFDFYELRLRRRQGDEDNDYVDVFQGVVFKLHFPERLFGRTVIAPRSHEGPLGFLTTSRAERELQEVGLVARAFEDRFRVYTDDQMEARYILDPAHMERLVALEESVDGSGLRAVIDGQDVYAAISGPNRFEISARTMSLADPGRLAKFLREIDAVFRLIETVLKRRDEPTPSTAYPIVGMTNSEP